MPLGLWMPEFSRSGTIYAIEDTSAPMFDRNKEIIDAVLVLHDVIATMRFSACLPPKI
jgi:hypothetical protein